MIKTVDTNKAKAMNTGLCVLLIALAMIGCSKASDHQETSIPQAFDMAVLGEHQDDIDIVALLSESDPNMVFDDFDDQYLSRLILVARDGTIKVSPNYEVNYNSVPDFSVYTHIPDKKQAFFDYLKPAIQFQNQLIRERRQLLFGIELKLKQELALSKAQTAFLDTMRSRYNVPEENSVAEAVQLLLRRVDTIPVSMVLAQAAMESGWGTSRFAREANNLFGQWCFSQGCGLVPSERDDGEVHEVAKFSSVDRAISAYFLNINSHYRYSKIRDVREQARSELKPLSGQDMVAGLEGYSERGEEYIEEIRSMIRVNKLE